MMKNKEADNDHPIHPLLKMRWSPRAFNGEPVDPGKLRRIFEAARWSPSASNDQPWAFLVGFKGDEVYEKIFGSLVEFNRLWVSSAPLLAVACARKTRLGKPGENPYRIYDLGQSMAHLTFQAMHEGVYVHQMGGIDTEKARELLSIPGDYEVKTAFVMGYPGDPEILHPNLKKSEYASRERRSSKNIVFTGSFGLSASFLEQPLQTI
jgi:nitroreductase